MKVFVIMQEAILTLYAFCSLVLQEVVPSDKHNSRTAKATGLIFFH